MAQAAPVPNLASSADQQCIFTFDVMRRCVSGLQVTWAVWVQ